MLIALAVVLGGISLYLNQDWFAKDNIQIVHRSRPARGVFFRRGKRAVTQAAVEPLFFSFDRKLKLTSLKVIPVQEIETNKYPHPIWDLISDSNSVPIKDLMLRHAYPRHAARRQGRHPRSAAARREIPAPDRSGFAQGRARLRAGGGHALTGPARPARTQHFPCQRPYVETHRKRIWLHRV